MKNMTNMDVFLSPKTPGLGFVSKALTAAKQRTPGRSRKGEHSARLPELGSGS